MRMVLYHRPAQSRLTSPSRLRASGVTLLEVILALALFSIAAVALVGTINQVAETSLTSQQIADVEQRLESFIDEYSKAPQLKELKEEIKPGADGVAYRIEVREVKDIKNREGRFLQNMFRIRAAAIWLEGGEPFELEAETLRYGGAWLPMN